MKKNEKQSDVIDLSEFDSSEEPSETKDQENKPKSAGDFLTVIKDGLFGLDSKEKKKKKIRNLMIIAVNFSLMFIILAYYFSTNKPNTENYEDSMSAEMMEAEMMREEI